ncbi:MULTISPECIES: CPBP family glutamic-type intramembrane protease [Bacillus]|uniref:CPBP family intramembrane metalloprotease n=1 Tax=Bacillus wiedmannii TaxID=1890302 RepID=A0A2B6H203_9BACI|nr:MULTISPECIES: CPBP family glutamic-type intramembrane protease [Bacillus]MDF9661502.1 CPBP family glutamic-type intramembrane protease [Bacillus wiedmannii]PGC12691.1 CPBP family intramembrane metalloprotease [Bacillus wiedmannii]PGD36679.1 CPBP family intramembrane metalloprotease [Bacillus wiedmannii]PGS08353.1 CPBP family intramembrane metalloprotease [Bacillus cereus]
MLEKLNKFMFALPVIWFVLLILLGTFLFVIPLDLFLPEVKTHPIKEAPVVLQIFLGVFAAPLYETVIFQVFLFWVLSCIPLIKDRDYLIILIASIIFGLSHSDGITYIVATAIIGVLYNYAYWVYQKKNEKVEVTISAFWVVFLIHSLHNSIVLIASQL